MPMTYTDKYGKKISVSMLDYLGGSERMMAKIAKQRKLEAEKAGKAADKPPGILKTPPPPPPSSPQLISRPTSQASTMDVDNHDAKNERFRLLARLNELNLNSENTKADIQNRKEGKEQNKKQAKKEIKPDKGKKAVRIDESRLFDRGELDFDRHSDTDPTVPGARATSNDYFDWNWVEEDRNSLTSADCGMIVSFYEHYKDRMFEAVASRFYDHTAKRVTPSEIKKIIQKGYLGVESDD